MVTIDILLFLEEGLFPRIEEMDSGGIAGYAPDNMISLSTNLTSEDEEFENDDDEEDR